MLIAQSLGRGLPELLTNLTAALQHPLDIHWTDKSLLSILICTGLYIMGLCVYASEQRRTRDGEEHGSAAWGSPRQVNAMFRQKENKILTRHVRLGLDTHKHRRSLNVLVIGGSGAAKTRSYVKPNILEANTNYVITDPKMEVLTATGGWLKSKGYDIRVLNLVNLEDSDGYNPFRYLRDEKDVLKLVNNLIQANLPNPQHFTDDGVSGTRFDRPGFLAMMEEVEAGRVEAIVIKDMSRLGRDYLKVGQIMEILRQRGVRLIAINDGVDSLKGDDDFTPFRNIMNEMFSLRMEALVIQYSPRIYNKSVSPVLSVRPQSAVLLSRFCQSAGEAFHGQGFPDCGTGG